jgi:hypothetical protein
MDGESRTSIHAANDMLPTLKVILATVIATCAAVLAISGGLIATRDPGEQLSGVPSMSRPLVRGAIVEETGWQNFRLLAYSRRADELQRLRDLPTAPARAVVEYAERAEKALEAERAPAAPVPTIVATAPAAPPPASEPAAVVTPPDAPAAPPAPTTVANAPAAAPMEAPAAPAATAAITQPATAPKPAAVETPATAAVTAAPFTAPAAASGGTQVAAIQSGSGETAAVKGTENPIDANPHPHVRRHARRDTHKKTVRVAVTRLAPAAKTGFPVEVPKTPAQGSATHSPAWTDNRQDSHARD